MGFYIGCSVRLIATGEVGVMISLWYDENGDLDSYIAFVGDVMEDGRPVGVPYVLRYYVSSLELVI